MSNTVIIAGGGIGGLAIAHGLKKNGIPFHIYERDQSAQYRAQGYRIRVARDAVGGLQWLFDETTWENFELTCGETRLAPIAEIDAQTAKVEEPNVDDAGPPPGAAKPYTVDRTMFRDVMLRGLADHISWGKQIERYEESDEGVTAFFADGSSAKGALLIGADGAHSKVRQQYIPNHKIVPTGGICVYGKTRLTDNFTKNIEPAVLRGMGALKDRSHGKYTVTVMEPVIFERREEMIEKGYQCPDDYLYWVLSGQQDALGLSDDTHKTHQESEAVALKIAENWHPKVKGILTQQEEGNTMVLPINSVPENFGKTIWPAGSHVTMIGDAVHVMGPTAGSGAIVALRDARTLCELLVQDGFANLKDTISKYESQMRDYATQTVNVSWKTGAFIFGQSKDNDQNIGEVMIKNRQRKH